MLFAYFDPDEPFDKLEMILEIGDGVTAETVWKHFKGQKTCPALSVDIPIQAAIDLHSAAFFLRDNLLETSNEQIWGLVFTLYPDSSFNIEYTYEKSDWLKGGE